MTALSRFISRLGVRRPPFFKLHEKHDKFQWTQEATKAAESSQETPSPSENITESPEVMKIHLDWRTPVMIYLRTGGLPEDKVERE
jgi:hypothetical protein